MPSGPDRHFKPKEEGTPHLVNLEGRETHWTVRGTVVAEVSGPFGSYDQAREFLVQLFSERGNTVDGTEPSLI